MYAFSCLDNLHLRFSRTLFCGVGFCAILYTAIRAVWLAKRYCSLLPPKSFCSAFSLYFHLSPSSKLSPAGLLFILRCLRSDVPSSHFCSLSTIFGSVGFIRFVFLSLQRIQNKNSSILRSSSLLRLCAASAKCF